MQSDKWRDRRYQSATKSLNCFHGMKPRRLTVAIEASILHVKNNLRGMIVEEGVRPQSSPSSLGVLRHHALSLSELIKTSSLFWTSKNATISMAATYPSASGGLKCTRSYALNPADVGAARGFSVSHTFYTLRPTPCNV